MGKFLVDKCVRVRLVNKCDSVILLTFRRIRQLPAKRKATYVSTDKDGKFFHYGPFLFVLSAKILLVSVLNLSSFNQILRERLRKSH